MNHALVRSSICMASFIGLWIAYLLGCILSSSRNLGQHSIRWDCISCDPCYIWGICSPGLGGVRGRGLDKRHVQLSSVAYTLRTTAYTGITSISNPRDDMFVQPKLVPDIGNIALQGK